jgi:hypothetical protein
MSLFSVEMTSGFLMNPGDSSDGFLDSDGDGYTALEEHLAGTLANDTTSQPASLPKPEAPQAPALPSKPDSTVFQLEFFQETNTKTSGNYYAEDWTTRSTRQALINYVNGVADVGIIRQCTWDSSLPDTGCQSTDSRFSRSHPAANFITRKIRTENCNIEETEDEATTKYDTNEVENSQGYYRINQFTGPAFTFLVEHESFGTKSNTDQTTTTSQGITTVEDCTVFTQEPSNLPEISYELVHWDGQALSIDGVSTALPSAERSGKYPYGQIRLPRLLKVDVVTDWNRDGAIAQADRKQATETTPFRFWVNDDDDVDETSGDDRPRSATADHTDAVVDSTRDLVDFFPVFIDLKDLLEKFDLQTKLSGLTITLRQKDNALNFVYTDLDPADAGDYLRESGLKTGFGPAFDQPPGTAATHAVTAEGTALNSAFLKKIRDGKGVLLFEGTARTSEPLLLEVSMGQSTSPLISLELPLSLASVSAMYHHVNLASRIPGSTESIPDATGEPANWPDALVNDKTFAFIHGYKVSQSAAQGWHAEVFKRLHQLGSRARFVGITWDGATGNDYHKAVYRAFVTSQHLAGELAAYSNLTIAAHSLGNMVVSNAIENHSFSPDRFCMLNAAVPIEAYVASPTNIADMQERMTEKSWQDYPDRLYAANWYDLFGPEDNRRELTWKDRFESVRNRAYNFYSSKEDVLEIATKGRTLGSGVWQTLFSRSEKGDKAWVLQEIGKGNGLLKLAGVDNVHGGWKINSSQSDLEQIGIQKSLPPVTDAYRPRKPSETSAILPTDEQLTQYGFFNRFHDYEGQSLYAPVYNSQAQVAAASKIAEKDDTQWHLLAEAVPALSDAAGAASVEGMQDNINMQDKQNGWPQSRLNDPKKLNRWLHSDFTKIPLNYVHTVYDNLIQIGKLNHE